MGLWDTSKLHDFADQRNFDGNICSVGRSPSTPPVFRGDDVEEKVTVSPSTSPLVFMYVFHPLARGIKNLC